MLLKNWNSFLCFDSITPGGHVWFLKSLGIFFRCLWMCLALSEDTEKKVDMDTIRKKAATRVKSLWGRRRMYSNINGKTTTSHYGRLSVNTWLGSFGYWYSTTNAYIICSPDRPRPSTYFYRSWHQKRCINRQSLGQLLLRNVCNTRTSNARSWYLFSARKGA